MWIVIGVMAWLLYVIDWRLAVGLGVFSVLVIGGYAVLFRGQARRFVADNSEGVATLGRGDLKAAQR